MLSLKLNSKFYNQDAITVAVKDYSSLGKVKWQKKGDYFEVSFDKIKAGIEGLILDEFKNYALAQMIKNR